MNSPGLLAHDHPSINCEQAWFLFSVGTPIVRLLLVEAKNKYAVHLIEYLHARDQICLPLLTVHRQCEFIGIRSDMVDEIPYVDFMLDMVEMSNLEQEPVSQIFLESMTQEEQAYTAQKLDSMAAAMENAPAENKPKCPTPKTVPRNEMQEDGIRDRITGALVNLGFNRRQVSSYVNNLGDKLSHERIDILIKEGIMQISGS